MSPAHRTDEEQFEELASHVAILQEMSDKDLLTDEELERFFSFVAQRVEKESKQRKGGDRVLTKAETRALYVNGFVAAAGNAAREIWGADIGELFDGLKPQA